MGNEARKEEDASVSKRERKCWKSDEILKKYGESRGQERDGKRQIHLSGVSVTKEVTAVSDSTSQD